ncbi:hypothetical protein BG004_005437 [Podila humilis]|nr:hypothetical protein BG004_005437 [Podila humilis]
MTGSDNINKSYVDNIVRDNVVINSSSSMEDVVMETEPVVLPSATSCCAIVTATAVGSKATTALVDPIMAGHDFIPLHDNDNDNGNIFRYSHRRFYNRPTSKPFDAPGTPQKPIIQSSTPSRSSAEPTASQPLNQPTASQPLNQPQAFLYNILERPTLPKQLQKLHLKQQQELDLKEQQELHLKEQQELDLKRQEELYLKQQCELQLKQQEELYMKQQCELQLKQQQELQLRLQQELHLKRQQVTQQPAGLKAAGPAAQQEFKTLNFLPKFIDPTAFYEFQFYRHGYNILFPYHRMLGSGEEWVRYMVKFETYDPILLRLRQVLGDVRHYCHPTYRPFMTTGQYYQYRAYDKYGMSLTENFVLSSKFASVLPASPPLFRPTETQKREDAMRRIDKYFVELQRMKDTGVSTIDRIDYLEDMANTELRASGHFASTLKRCGFK